MMQWAHLLVLSLTMNQVAKKEYEVWDTGRGTECTCQRDTKLGRESKKKKKKKVES